MLLSGQLTHASLVSPTLPLYLPASQRLQAAEDPDRVLNVPEMQAVTLLPPPVKPAAARQSDSAVWPVDTVWLLAGQLSQVSLVWSVIAL